MYSNRRRFGYVGHWVGSYTFSHGQGSPRPFTDDGDGSRDAFVRARRHRRRAAARVRCCPHRPDLTPRRLYDSHFPFVWRNLRRLGVPDVILEDAAQDVFLVVHRRWDSFDSRWSSVETWLFGILMRVARNHRRSLRRRAWAIPSTGDIVEVVPSTAAGPAELVARREAVALLDRLLDSLDEDKRAIIVLVDVEQLSVPQAAESLEVNLNTAYWRLRTARTQLRKSLARIRATENRSETDREGSRHEDRGSRRSWTPTRGRSSTPRAAGTSRTRWRARACAGASRSSWRRGSRWPSGRRRPRSPAR